MKTGSKQTKIRETAGTAAATILSIVLVVILIGPVALHAQGAQSTVDSAVLEQPSAAPPPSNGGIFPLGQVRRGLSGTAWTVFSGSKPEPMQVEILGVLRGARGPGQDMILARLHGTKAEYTGVVEGMSGSPVYIGNKLLGALSYRIGQFSKEPIAGITPIADMLEVRDIPAESAVAMAANQGAVSGAPSALSTSTKEPAPAMNFQMMETPLVMSGFRPEAIRLWQQKMAGSSLADVAAGGMGASSSGDSETAKDRKSGSEIDRAALASIVPGSAVSAQLVRGDMEISATCTVTYIDPKQLLACGHPILQAGPISLPMTTADVVATLASPLNAFKIINTGATIGAFTQDRGSAISGALGGHARMIPMHIQVDGPLGKRTLNVEILDLPSLTAQAMEVVLYDALLEANDSTAENSYHVTGSISLDGYSPLPINLWATPTDTMAAPLQAALLTGDRFVRLYSNGARQGAMRSIDLQVEAVSKRAQVELAGARIVSNDSARAGETVVIEATLRPWQQPARNVRIPVKLPARLAEGNLRMLVSDSGTLDRTLNQPLFNGRQPDLNAVMAQYSHLHAADRVYVSLLLPEAQAGISGNTLTSMPLSMANALEPMRSAQSAGLNGESAVVAADAPAGGVLYGFQVINLHIEPGGGLD